MRSNLVVILVAIGIFCGGILPLAVANEWPFRNPDSRSIPVEEEIHLQGSFDSFEFFGPFVPSVAAAAGQTDLCTNLWIAEHIAVVLSHQMAAQSRGPPSDFATYRALSHGALSGPVMW
jgi:hypothetical protein